MYTLAQTCPSHTRAHMRAYNQMGAHTDNKAQRKTWISWILQLSESHRGHLCSTHSNSVAIMCASSASCTTMSIIFLPFRSPLFLFSPLSPAGKSRDRLSEQSEVRLMPAARSRTALITSGFGSESQHCQKSKKVSGCSKKDIHAPKTEKKKKKNHHHQESLWRKGGWVNEKVWNRGRWREDGGRRRCLP